MSDEENKKLEERIKQLEKEVKILRDDKKTSSVEDLASQVAMSEKLLEIELKMADARGDGMKKYQLAGELIEKMTESQKDAFKRGGEEAKKVAAELGVTLEQLQNMHDLYNDLGEVGQRAYKDMRNEAEGLAQKMFLVDDNADRIVGNIIKIGDLAKSPDGLKGMAMAIKDTFKPIRIFSSLVLKVWESTLKAITATDAATASFAKQTGMGRVATAGISKLGTEYANLGINVELAGKAFTAATENIAGFNDMSEATQQKIGLTAAMFERLGAGAETGTQMMEDLSKRFDITAAAASDMTRDLALSAKGIGMTMKTFVKSFNAANKSLAVYGREGVKVFKNVASAARAAGVETEALLGLAGKFDTFSDAADTTGKLNAILGTQMSAMDLLTMKEDERIEYLLRNMQVTGKSFKQMNKFEQMAIANAAGITDMAQANKIFGMSFKDYKKNQRNMAAQEKGQEEANKRMKEAMDITEKLSAIMREFVIKGIGPFVDDIALAVEKLGDFIHWMMDGHGALILFTAGISGVALMLSPLVGLLSFFGFNLKFVGVWMMRVVGLMLSKIPILGKLNILQAQQNVLQNGSARVSVVQAKAMTLLGKSIMFMGIGIGVAAAGVSLLVLQFGKLSGTKMLQVSVAILVLGAAFAAFVLLMMKMAPATAVAATSLLYLGGAFLLISIGIAIVAVSMAFLVQSIAALGKSGMAAVGVLYALAGATFSLAGATALLGNPFSLIGMMSLLATMDRLISLSTAMQGMSQGVAASVSGLGSLANDIKDAVEKFAQLANADFFAVFSGLYFGIRAFISALDLKSQYGVKVSHTLENLALIATGTSARTLSGNTGNAIVGAINRLVSKEKDKQVIKVTVDAEDIKNALRDGYFELRAE